MHRFAIVLLSMGAVASAEPLSVEALTREAKRSLVTIRQADRADGDGGVGSGFVVSEGKVATNFHVIGEGRAISVEWADGAVAPVTSIVAWDRTMDLAIVEVATSGAERPALPLGDSEILSDGAALVALGAPQGLKVSVVQGVLSAHRDVPEFPGVKMLQIAMPIEPGNSGGPLLDLEGRVQGLVTLRSLRAPNLGFAVPVNALKVLLAKPNPVPIERWQTIGALDPKVWEPALSDGVRWSQRAGHLRAEGRGTGFGGRALCLSPLPPPDLPYEVSVRVRLGDESGAAGIAFCADGADRHYGFYPTNGALRLTRFDGPDVFSWNILADVRSPLYRPREWNDLRVRLEPNRIVCFLNGEKVIESEDATLRGGRAGLCKFRESSPAFRQFRVGTDLAPDTAEADREFYLRQARALEKSASQFHAMAAASHQDAVESELLAAVNKKDEADVDLILATLLLAKLDDPELDPAAYRDRIARLGAEFAQSLGPNPTVLALRERLDRLNEFFFHLNGFHGARFDYENRANSRLPEVLDDREGIPIMLCALYLEIGRAGGLDLVGLPRPGQFVVGLRDPGSERPLVIDVFDGGALLDEPETAALSPASKREILSRMLNNLQAFALREDQRAAALRYASLGVALDPADVRARLARAALALDQKNPALAEADLQRLTATDLDAPTAAMVERLREALSQGTQ